MPGSLKSMKITKSEKKSQTEVPSAISQPEYPYGLEIRLDNDSLKKLGMSKLPQVGDKMVLAAKVEITGASMRQTKNGSDDKTVTLQITDMALGEKQSKTDAGKALYGDGDK